MSMLFLVTADSGMYSDYESWAVRVFDTEHEAKEFADACSAEWRKLYQQYVDLRKRGASWEQIRALKSPLDPGADASCGNTNYHVEEVPYGPA